MMKQAITWANAYTGLCRNTASLDHNQLKLSTHNLYGFSII